MERYRLQERLNFISAELHKGFDALFNPNTAPDWKEFTKELIGKRLSYTAQQLTGKNYLMGDIFTVADAYLFTILSWGKGVEIDIRRWRVMTAYAERIAQRSTVHTALEAEGLIK